jgi:hypothetical protein
MTDSRRDEKEEKEEKRHEKEEKGRSDSLGTIVWGIIIIWAGLVLLADNMGMLAAIRFADTPFPGFRFLARIEAWSLIFFGAGVIILVEAVIRYVMPAYRRGVWGTVILAFVFIGIGLGSWVGWNVVWPLILIAIGVIVLLGALGWRR